MNKYLVLASFLFSFAFSFAQTKPKPKEKPPTQKEMADMMKEMQGALDSLSPEDKKMMDSMGFKMPSLKNMPPVSNAQLAEDWKNKTQLVPNKDLGRIAAIPKTISDSKMGSYIAAIQNQIESVLKPAIITTGKEMHDYLQSNNMSSDEAANHAIGFWVAGQPELAVYVLGNICVGDVSNTDNLNNYAALLSMQGAEHLAIPILNNLNQKFPGNSTLLNNLGQAWFGLGEIGKAEKYLDSSIRICAYHPHANLTKSMIEESKGNKKAAIESVKKSIVKAYSREKESRLNKLGYQLQSNDLTWDRPMPQDALGLEKFKRPEFPMTVAECEQLKEQWDAFIQECEEKIIELQPLRAQLEQECAEASNSRSKKLLEGKMVDLFPRLAHKAMIKLAYLIDDKDGYVSSLQQSKFNAVLKADAESDLLRDQLSKRQNEIYEKYKDKFGEGKPNPFEEACKDETQAKNEFLSIANSGLVNASNSYLSFMKRKINDELYYAQYTKWPDEFEMLKVQAKLNWINMVKTLKPIFLDKSNYCLDKKNLEPKPTELAEFDDIACQYNSTMDWGCVKMETNCSHTTTTFGCESLSYLSETLGSLSFTKRELGQNYIGGTLKVSPELSVGVNSGPLSVQGSIGADITVNLDESNRVKNWEGKVKSGVEAGVGIQKGPIKAGATIGAGLEMEIGNNGIEDINIVSSAKAEVGIAAPTSAGNQKIDNQINKGIDLVNDGLDKLSTSAEIGVKSRSSIFSGHGSVEGLGVLSGVKMAGW